MPGPTLLSVVLVICGLALHYIINRQRFNRRNVCGLQSYSSYEKNLLITLLEKLGKVLANLLLLSGILLYCIS